MWSEPNTSTDDAQRWLLAVMANHQRWRGVEQLGEHYFCLVGTNRISGTAEVSRQILYAGRIYQVLALGWQTTSLPLVGMDKVTWPAIINFDVLLPIMSL